MSSRLLIAVCATTIVLPSAAARADNPTLVGTVGQNDAYKISLTDANGVRVHNLAPGTYTIQIHDLSRIHNFHLFGPGVDQLTEVDTTSDPIWTVDLQEGTYTYHCDAHPYAMSGSFTVGTARMLGVVGPRKKISLLWEDGAKVTNLAGPVQAVISVNDRTHKDNFHLVGPGVNKTTGVGFRGRATWRLTLQPGTYVYRSDKHKTLRGSFIVTSS